MAWNSQTKFQIAITIGDSAAQTNPQRMSGFISVVCISISIADTMPIAIIRYNIINARTAMADILKSVARVLPNVDVAHPGTWPTAKQLTHALKTIQIVNRQ